jgi:pimeloyl-ACP methyl ester carboxylesterase
MAARCLLPDGRRIGHTALGPADGLPIVYLHGLIGTSLRTSQQAAAAVHQTGVRLVLPSRPGFGGSCAQRTRTLGDAADDVGAFADNLGLERFALLGVSAGGPVALACAHRLGARITATAVVSGAAPIQAPQTPTERWLARAARHRHASAALAAPGIAALRIRGAGIRSARALLQDGCLAIGPRGFDPAEIHGEVHIWHGAQDGVVPADRAVELARSLPNAHATILLGEGHFFLRRHLTQVLGALQQASAVQRYVAVPAA